MAEDGLQEAPEPLPPNRTGWIFKIPFYGFLLLFGMWLMHGILFPHVTTPAEMKAEIAEAQALEARQTANMQKIEQRNALCALRPLCSKYAQARQECAVAGSYDKCLEIRLGSENVGLTSGCTDDGKLAFVPPDLPDLPGSLECFIRNLNSHKPGQ